MTNRRNITIRTTDEWVTAAKTAAEITSREMRMPVSMNTFIELCLIEKLQAAGYTELARLARTPPDPLHGDAA